MKELLSAYAAYNLWANKTFADFILKLPASDVTKELPSSFKTIQQTLFHMCWAENTWRQRLLLAEKVLPLNDDLLTDIPGLCKEFIYQSNQIQQWVISKSELALNHVFQYQNTRGEFFKQPVSEVLLQIFNHGAYHRGQLVNMFRQLGHENIPQTDFIIWARSKKM